MAFKKASLSLDFSFEQDGTNDFGGPSFTPELRKSLKFAAGILSGQADRCFIDYRTIAASGSDPIDLTGTLTDVYGTVITQAELVGIIVSADADNVNDVLVGGGTNPVAAPWGAAGDIIKVRPNGLFVSFAYNAAGIGAIIATTGDILNFANGGAGTPVNYSVAFLGRSA